MKIIDLLNKIANGEEVPKIIKLNGNIYDYEPESQDYYNRSNLRYKYLFDEWFHISKVLNNEVEILDEPKKIEKITVREKTLGFPNGEWTARNMDKAFAIKINEIIDRLNKEEE